MLDACGLDSELSKCYPRSSRLCSLDLLKRPDNFHSQTKYRQCRKLAITRKQSLRKLRWYASYLSSEAQKPPAVDFSCNGNIHGSGGDFKEGRHRVVGSVLQDLDFFQSRFNSGGSFSSRRKGFNSCFSFGGNFFKFPNGSHHLSQISVLKTPSF